MSALLTLRTARAAGLTFHVEGEHLILEAPSAPPADVLEAVSRHKAEILNLLRSDVAGWSPEDWQVLFDERAGIAEYDGGLSRSLASAASTGRTRARTLPSLWHSRH